jgi:hypothetical protein
MHGKHEKCIKVVVGNIEGERLLWRTRRGGEDYIKVDETSCDGFL